MSTETKPEVVDFYQLYADVTRTEFMQSLGLTDAEMGMLRMLNEQRDKVNPLYIPELVIEGLVHPGNTPYQAVKTLHKLKEQRVILYELCRDVGGSHIKYEDVIFTPLEKMAEREGINLKEMLEMKEEAVEVTQTEYRRVALFNIEYPVIYFCFQEDKNLDSDLEDDNLNLMYTRIQEDRLAEYLTANNPALLEFLNYMQSKFSQKMTEVQREEKTEAPEGNADQHLPGGRGLAGRDESGGDRNQVQQAQVHHLPVDSTPGVGRSGGWQNTQETQGEGADRRQAPDEAHGGYGAPMGIGK